MTARDSLTEIRYNQVDLHDAHRSATRWQRLLEANRNGGSGLSPEEALLLKASLITLTIVRKDALGTYYLRPCQMSFDEA